MRKFWNKLINIIYRIISTKLGRFLFELMNTVGLTTLVLYLCACAELLLAFIVILFLISNIVLLIDKYNEKNNIV